MVDEADIEEYRKSLTTLKFGSTNSVLLIKHPNEESTVVIHDGWKREHIGTFPLTVSDTLNLLRRSAFALVAGGINIQHIRIHTIGDDPSTWGVEYEHEEPNALRLHIV